MPDAYAPCSLMPHGSITHFVRDADYLSEYDWTMPGHFGQIAGWIKARLSIEFKQQLRYKEADYIMIIFCDGSCEPTNPGGYACWAWVTRDGKSDYGCIGYGDGMTNNVAEYQAVVKALRWVKKNNIHKAAIKTDSKLVVEQSNGNWRVRAEHLQATAAEVKTLLKLTQSTIQWLPRELNQKADELTKKAFEEATSRNQSSSKWERPTQRNKLDWKTEPISDRQKQSLAQFGLTCNPAKMTWGQAADILNKLFNQK